MRTKCKQLLSLLLVFVLALGLISPVYATTDDGVVLTTEPAATETTDTDFSGVEDGTISEDELRWAAISAELPSPIEGYSPLDPDNPHPYGVPVDNFYPSSIFEVDPYALMPMADMSAIPDEMYDNAILRALEYTGYNVQWLKNKG